MAKIALNEDDCREWIALMAEIRLNKIIADAGISSRRGADELIIAGRVTVDGSTIRELGAKFDPDKHKVEVDGETITRTLSKSYLVLHKPKGVLSTMFDPEGRPSLMDFIDLRKERLFHVGRLDKDSEGLILLTNDGDLTFRATHPSFGLEKRYIIEFDGKLPTGVDKLLMKGVELEDGIGRVLTFSQLSPQWIEVSIHEGRYHIIRRLMEAVGVDVLRLIRTHFGPISLGETPEGRWRDLNSAELLNLQNALNIKP
jgi:23S rRNA pseudouridine2605 synthase